MERKQNDIPVKELMWNHTQKCDIKLVFFSKFGVPPTRKRQIFPEKLRSV